MRRLFGRPCSFLIFLLFLAGCGGRDGPANFLLISVDTLRADHLGAYGYGRNTSPVLDQLAADGFLFESVISQSSWTLPSHVTMMTSLYPSTHKATLEDRGIDPAIPVLAELLRENGFETAGFIDHIFVSSIYGFDRGFDRFDEMGGGVAGITARAARWLRERKGERFFLFLHLFDVHCPYTPPQGYRGLFRAETSIPFDLEGKCGNPDFNRMELSGGQVDYLVDQYDGEVAHLDAVLGLFFSELREMGIWENTLLMVTSDHGEEFGDHGQIGHERTLYDETLRVPWIARIPGRIGNRIAPTVRLLDLAPTALAILGLPVPDRFQGRSVLPLLEGGEMSARPAFSELDRHVRQRSIHSGSYHLIGTARPSVGSGGDDFRWEMYDIDADRREQRDLIGSLRADEILPALKKRLREIEAEAVAAGAAYRPQALKFLDEEQRRRMEETLRSLGYLP